eukprot:m.184694 g.184694  ORF g.184694 m.184694 type:complete len:109 (-) comp53527_c0_seq11:444-770(-)
MQPARSASHSSSSLSARVVPWNGTLPLSSTASRAGQYIVSSEQVPLAYLRVRLGLAVLRRSKFFFKIPCGEQHPAPFYYIGPAETQEHFDAGVESESPPAYCETPLSR